MSYDVKSRVSLENIRVKHGFVFVISKIKDIRLVLLFCYINYAPINKIYNVATKTI